MDLNREEQQLFRSCEIIFGPHLNISREFLEYLQPSGLKGAYRRRAMETHPDALLSDDLPGGTGNSEKFHRVQQAYEQLCCYLKFKSNNPPPTPHRQSTVPSSGNETEWSAGKEGDRKPSYRPTVKPTVSPHKAREAPEYSPTKNLYCGPIPQRRLLFGHFLYYSGLANWRTITRILTWQRTERPRLGEIGLRFGMLRPEDIASILRAKEPRQKFGQTASNLGILNDYQVRALLFHQQRLQKKFGAILLEKKLVDPIELQKLLDEFERHNADVLHSLRGL